MIGFEFDMAKIPSIYKHPFYPWPAWPALCSRLFNCLFVRPSIHVHSFVCCQNWERDILKICEPLLMQIGTSGPMSTGHGHEPVDFVGEEVEKVGSQGHMRPKIDGLAEASLLTPLGRVAVLGNLKNVRNHLSVPCVWYMCAIFGLNLKFFS